MFLIMLITTLTIRGIRLLVGDSSREIVTNRVIKLGCALEIKKENTKRKIDKKTKTFYLQKEKKTTCKTTTTHSTTTYDLLCRRG